MTYNLSKSIRLHWLKMGGGMDVVYGKSTSLQEPVGEWKSAQFWEAHFGLGGSYLFSDEWGSHLYLTNHYPDLRSPGENTYIQIGLEVNYYF